MPLGSARTYGDGRDLTMLTWGNGLLMSLRVARRLEERGIRARVVDLRWLAPLPIEDIAREAVATQRVLVVDETRRTGGVSEGVIATLIDAGFDGQLARVTSKDSFIPLGDAAKLVLLSEDEIEAAALARLSPASAIRTLWLGFRIGSRPSRPEPEPRARHAGREEFGHHARDPGRGAATPPTAGSAAGRGDRRGDGATGATTRQPCR